MKERGLMCDDMLEFIEAPLSYFLGVPTCNMEYIDKAALHDVVVIDCDNGFSSPDYFDGRRGMRATKLPTPLPASVSSNISKLRFLIRCASVPYSGLLST